MSNKHRGATRRRQKLHTPDNQGPRDRRVVPVVYRAEAASFPRIPYERVRELLLAGQKPLS